MSVYVYTITDADHPLRLEGLQGVGDPPSPLRTIVTGRLAAVVSDAPDDLRPKRRDLAAHEEVQERLLGDGTALPLRFGLVAQDDDSVRAELEERADVYGERLKKVDGRVELNLKVAQDEEALLREVLLESEEARRLHETVRAGQGNQDTNLALGEMLAGLVQTRQQTLADDIVGTLRELTDDESISPPAQDDFLNASFLVRREKVQEFAQAEQKLASAYGENFGFRLRGPLPPYSFV